MTDYKRIILAQFGVTSPLVFFSPYRGLVWWRKVSLTQDEIDASFWTTNFNASFDDPEAVDETVIINTVSWRGRQLSEIDNLDDLFLEGVINSFFMDVDTQILYIKNFDYLPAWQTPDLVSGVVTGVATMADVDAEGRPFNAAFGGLEYEMRLIESSITDHFKLDNWSNNIMQFENFSFALLNPDGQYDNTRDDVLNQTAKVLMAEVPSNQPILIDDFVVIAQGNISDVSFPDAETAQVTVADIRSAWDDIIPATVYPVNYLGILDPESRLIDKNMPLVLGQCLKVPAYYIGSDGSNDVFHVSYATSDDPISAITSAYELIEGQYVALTINGVDLSNGTVSIQLDEATDQSKVFCDVVGRVAPSISVSDPVGNTAIDMAVKIIAAWAQVPFITSYFNVGNITAVRDRRPYQISLAFPLGGVTMTEAIEQCTFSVNTVFYTNGQVLDIAEMTVSTNNPKVVYVDDLVNVPPIVWDQQDYMSRISTEYSRDYGRDIPKTIADAQFEDSARSRYIFTKQYNFGTGLVLESDAQAIGFERYNWSVLMRPRIVLEFGGPMEIEFLDVVSFNYRQYDRQRLQPALYRVTSISRTRNSAELTFIENQAVAIGHRIGRQL